MRSRKRESLYHSRSNIVKERNKGGEGERIIEAENRGSRLISKKFPDLSKKVLRLSDLYGAFFLSFSLSLFYLLHYPLQYFLSHSKDISSLIKKNRIRRKFLSIYNISISLSLSLSSLFLSPHLSSSSHSSDSLHFPHSLMITYSPSPSLSFCFGFCFVVYFLMEFSIFYSVFGELKRCLLEKAFP